MARGVLGNDPFKRGAASRPASEGPAEGSPKKKSAKAKKPASKKAAPAKKRPARREQVIEPPLDVVAPDESAPETPVDEEIPLPAHPEHAHAAPEELAPELPVQEEATVPRLEVSQRAAREAAPEQVIEPEVEVVAPDESAPEVPIDEEIPLPAHEAAPPVHPSLRDRAAGAIVLGRDLLAGAAQSGALATVFESATGLFRALQTGLGTAGSTNLDEYGKDPSLTQELRPFASFFYDTYWRVTVEGAQNVPSGPCILVSNHSGAVPFDGPVLHGALMRERGDLPEARWLVEDQVFHAPFFGVLLNRLGAVRACPENAIRLLQEGRPVIVFPEGVQGISKPFSHRYRLMRFGRGGFVKIALRTRVPIVPVAIVGAEEAMPMLARLPGKMFGVPYVPLTTPVPLPTKWTVRFGQPIDMGGYPDNAADDLVLVHQLTDKTREAVQGMIDSLLKSRDGVF